MKKAILINDTSNEYHIGSRTVVSTMEELCNKNGIELVRKLTRKQIGEQAEVDMVAIQEADLILINGEGSLHHHPRVSTSFFKIVMNYVKKNQKVALINTLWEEMDYRQIKKHLDKIDLISFRESLSKENFTNSYYHPNILVVPDLIFYNDVRSIQEIGYGDSVIQRIRNTFKRMPNYFPLGMIDTGKYNAPETLNMPSLYSYITWLKSLDLYVTGRFHGVCLATLAGAPFLTYDSNSHKIRGILKDMDCSELLIREQGDIKKKQSIAKDYLPKMRKYRIKAKKQIEDLFKRINKL